MTAKLDGTNGLLQQYDYQVLTTGFSYTFAAGTTVLVMNPAGTLATGTITMPAAPADGMTISFSSTQAITALTVNGNTGQSIVGKPTTMNAGGAATFVYRLSNTTWYTQVNTTVSSTGVPVLNVYTSPGTYDATTAKAAGLKAIKVTVVGGGGGGGGTTGANASATGAGGGGASILIYPAPSLPGPQPYTVGTGGTAGPTSSPGAGGAGNTSSFGVAPITVISATGGAGGTTGGTGGAGGTGSNGTLNVGGSGGMTGIGSGTTGSGFGGSGGSSMLGGGAQSVKNTNATGIAGNNYGGGGGGGSGTSVAEPGGVGASGVVIVEEFY